jgi:predicted negative regulator of RcsB-dependent stress response
MVEDYLSDREQEEALRTWWSENWRWIIGGVALGLALLGAWQYWGTYRARTADHAARLYEEFRVALVKPDVEQAGRLLQDLASEHEASAYTQQGRLLLAKAQVDAGKVDAALPLLQTVIDKSKDKELAQVARLRSARLLIQQGKHDEALKLLDAEKAGAFAAQVREVRGDALLAKGDNEGARAEYAAALAAQKDALADARIDRSMLELKLQEVGGEKAVGSSVASVQGQP